MENTALVKGSLSQIARETGKTLAQSWIEVDAVILVDVSWSMNDQDARGGKSRWTVAQEELTKLQGSLPGKLAIIAFSDECTFVPTGSIPPTQGGTELGRALKYVRMADKISGMRFIVISDGEPMNEQDSLEEAKKFKNKIDCVYVGPESGAGREFLKKLATASGGEFMLKPKLELLASGVQKLLEG